LGSFKELSIRRDRQYIGKARSDFVLNYVITSFYDYDIVKPERAHGNSNYYVRPIYEHLGSNKV
jgi:hypothetical protein